MRGHSKLTRPQPLHLPRIRRLSARKGQQVNILYERPSVVLEGRERLCAGELHRVVTAAVQHDARMRAGAFLNDVAAPDVERADCRRQFRRQRATIDVNRGRIAAKRGRALIVSNRRGRHARPDEQVRLSAAHDDRSGRGRVARKSC